MLGLNQSGHLILTPDVADVIADAHDEGNKVTWRTDKATWGVVEKWAYPKQVGRSLIEDCDGICLHKRRILIDHGIPPQVIMMTICLDPNGAGHAVLTVTTGMGDIILCNNHKTLTTPGRMKAEGYRFLYQQQPGKALDDEWSVLA